MSKMMAMAIPIVHGKEEAWKTWQKELRTTWFDEFAASRKKMGVHERTFLQHTPMGDLVVVTLEGDEPGKAFEEFAKADSDFSKWFFENVKELHGVDLSQPPEGPMPELIIDSEKRI